MRHVRSSAAVFTCLLALAWGVGTSDVTLAARAVAQEIVAEQVAKDVDRIVGDASLAPAWISVEREIDEAEGVERRLVVGTRSTDVRTLEEDFHQRALEITRQYLRELLGDRADSIKLDGARLSSVIAPKRVFVERTSDSEGVSFVRYGQLVFDDSFRRWAIGEGRRSGQWSRLLVWAASFGGLVVILSAGALRLRLSRRETASSAT